MKKKFILILTTVLFISKSFCTQNEVYVEGNDSLSDFYIQTLNTTVEEYNQFLRETGTETNYNDDTWKYADRPLYEIIISEKSAVANISFIEVVKYANWLSKKNNLQEVYIIDLNGNIKWNKNANGYRLPTCDEWEWAAKGGIYSKNYKYPGSDNLDEVAWYLNNSGDKIHAPGLKKPNELGIYDMFGNVGEWCWDEFVIFAGDVILEGENATPKGQWKTKRKQFSASKELQWIYMEKDKLMQKNIDLDLEYIKSNICRVSFYTPFWKKDKEIDYNKFYIMENSGSYLGIRLVRNASN